MDELKMGTSYISLVQDSQLAFNAAASRLGKSKRNLTDFLREHANHI
jgi:hypothetical protein